jgi:hypothetical protein
LSGPSIPRFGEKFGEFGKVICRKGSSSPIMLRELKEPRHLAIRAYLTEKLIHQETEQELRLTRIYTSLFKNNS